MTSIDKLIMDYEDAHKCVLNFNYETYTMSEDDNVQEDNIYNKREQYTDINDEKKTLASLKYNYVKIQHNISKEFENQYNISDNFTLLFNKCNLFKVKHLKKSTYNSIIELLNLIKNNVICKDEHTDIELKKNMDNIYSIINFYINNRLPILETYKYMYNLAFIKIIYIYLNNIRKEK